eukprot:13061670-Alexandrium_andersonii.AAC.1
MSASLVGSEMCIRDRAMGMPRRPHLTCCWWLLPGPGGRRPEHPAGRLGCLLYTSDAADDM